MARDGNHGFPWSFKGLSRLWGHGDQGAVLLIRVEIIHGYLEAHFGSHQFIIIASFTDTHKNYEGFSNARWIRNPFTRIIFFLKVMGVK